MFVSKTVSVTTYKILVIYWYNTFQHISQNVPTNMAYFNVHLLASADTHNNTSIKLFFLILHDRVFVNKIFNVDGFHCLVIII